MSHEGPHPSEALPAGEEPLTVEETGRIAEFMFGHLERTKEFLGDDFITEDSVSPEEWEVIQGTQERLKNGLVDSLKKDMIDNRD